jgi:undecaprenyl-diphosphatase
VLLGIIEGITEFLPISSTGHLLLAEHFLPLHGQLFKNDQLFNLFNVVIQSGAVIAVLPLFPERLTQFVQKWREPATVGYLIKLGLAFVITGVGGIALEKYNFKLPKEALPVALPLVIGGVGFIAIEQWLKNRTGATEITWTIALAVGIGQLLAAIFPGLSRSGATILLALVLGLSRPAATEFSFLVGIPTMLAAGGLKIFKAVQAGIQPESWGLVMLGTVVSAVVSFLVVKWLLRYIQTHTFTLFGWYRIALGVVVIMVAWDRSPVH